MTTRNGPGNVPSEKIPLHGTAFRKGCDVPFLRPDLPTQEVNAEGDFECENLKLD